MSLQGKVALVTGAAQGLGKAFSEALLKRGARVCLTDIQREKGETTVSALQQHYGQDRALFVKCDVTSDSEMKNTFSAMKQQFGRLDIMVNNAGIIDEKNAARTISINVTGVITGTNLAIERMSKEKGGNGGVIINVASLAALTTKVYPMPVYTATKFAVLGFTQAWAHNPYLKSMGVQLACLCPGFTDTDILQCDGAKLHDIQKFIDQIGINKVSTVVEGFMQLVEDVQCNGAVMAITPSDGIYYDKKPLASSKK